MKLLRNTVLTYNNISMVYEIFLVGQMLLFKPYFYQNDEEFPCIVLGRTNRGWVLPENVDIELKKQILEDVAGLKLSAEFESFPTTLSSIDNVPAFKRA